jgi:hypothetical protein
MLAHRRQKVSPASYWRRTEGSLVWLQAVEVGREARTLPPSTTGKDISRASFWGRSMSSLSSMADFDPT